MRARENIEPKSNLFSHQQSKQPNILSCQVSKNKLVVQLNDGREVGITIDLLEKWVFSGEKIKARQLAKYELWNEGKNVYFPDLDEILPVRIFAKGLFSSCDE
ncbi:MAG: hypothetical protein MRECE_4c006 [Mycoplasmataceae bacterium CE_OT135]|nr:MAG: hypothetical protein MRECE_4c006 [Mycoplasmataceae bacterium CE_OT135]